MRTAAAFVVVVLLTSWLAGAFDGFVGVRILACIASYNLQQFVHLGRQIEALRDLCEAGASVEIVVHATEEWPPHLEKELRRRLFCYRQNVSVMLTVRMLPPNVRLMLTNQHRFEMYKNLERFDLFLYAEDDLLVTPGHAAAFLAEEQRLYDAGKDIWTRYTLCFLRYEYNTSFAFLNDTNRDAMRDVRRVFWEHKRPLATTLPLRYVESSLYIRPKRTHTGMFFATQRQLRHYEELCQFSRPTKRPGTASQPSRGTQRVWMAGLMLFDKTQGCGITPVIPAVTYSSFTLHHLPDKNFRRVGKKGRIQADLVPAEELDEYVANSLTLT